MFFQRAGRLSKIERGEPLRAHVTLDDVRFVQIDSGDAGASSTDTRSMCRVVHDGRWYDLITCWADTCAYPFGAVKSFDRKDV